MVFTKRASQSAPLTQNNSYGALSFQMRARIPHFYSVRILRSRFNLVHRKTRRTEHERVGKTPIHLRCEKYPHGTNRSSSLLRQKGTPRNRAPQQQNLTGLTQSISHSFPAIHSCQRFFPYTEERQIISKPEKILIELLSHPFPSGVFTRKSRTNSSDRKGM